MIFIVSSNLYAQITDVITGLSGSTQIRFNGTELYLSEFGGNKIPKIDISSTLPIVTDVIMGISDLADLAFYGTNHK